MDDITRFFEKLTRENWGFPWHIILAASASWLLLILFAMGLSSDFWFQSLIVFLIVNVIGIINELIQKKRGTETSRGMWQDILANNIGIIGAIVAYGLFLSVH